MYDDILFKIINPSLASTLEQEAHLQGNLIQKKQYIPILAGTSLYNVDYLAPPLEPVNFNVFGRLFDIYYGVDGITYVWSILPSEYH